MEPIRLFRRRYYPDEIIELKNDQILSQDKNLIVTKWNVLKPRKDIASGYSAYYIDKGYKVSKILDASGNLVYWYCDIIETVLDKTTNTYTFCDLLIDVLIYPNGHVEVVDLDELADILEANTLPPSMVAQALRNTSQLLAIIYSGNFSELTRPITRFSS